MPQFYYPDFRIPFDTDGTRVFYRRVHSFSWPTFLYELDWFEVDPLGVTYLNSTKRYGLCFGVPDEGTTHWAWEVALIFPEPMDLSGILWSGSNPDGFGPIGIDPVQVPYLSVSKNTTAIDDGTWSEGIQVPQATSYGLWNTSDIFIPADERARFRVYNQDTHAEEWRSGGVDVYGAYRDQMPSFGKGIVPLFGDAYRSVKGIRLAMLDDPSGDVFDTRFFPLRNIINLYGTPALTTEPWGLKIVNDDGSDINPNTFELGNILQSNPGSMTYSWPRFRVKNFSDTETANSVVLRVYEDQEQQMMVGVPTYDAWYIYDRMHYASARINSGAWQAPANTLGSTIDLSIGTLAPGALSSPIDVRITLPDPQVTFVPPNYGHAHLRFQPIVGAWS